MRQDPLFSMIHVHHMNEGTAVEIDSPGFADHVEMQSVGFQGQVPLDDLIRDGPAAYLNQAMQAAEAFIAAQHNMLFAKADEVTSRTGMVIDGKGMGFSPELLLEALERIEMSFSDSGQPQMPTIVMHPQLLATIREKIPIWETDPAFKKRYAELIERKRKVWIDRKNSRKLAD
jgi:hypothetical protein